MASVLAAITAAPRDPRLLAATVASVKLAGFGDPLVVAEPETDIRDAHFHKRRLGPCRNFLFALRAIVRRRPGYCVVFQDDILLARGLWPWLADRAPRGVASLWTCAALDAGYRGWQVPSHLGWGALAYVIPLGIATALSKMKPDATQTDHAVAAWCRAAGVGYWQHLPSFALHTGVESTLHGGGGARLDCRRQCRTWVKSVDPWTETEIDLAWNTEKLLSLQQP